MQIMAAANQNRFSACLEAAAKMKAAGLRPDASIYNALMGLAARSDSWLFSWAIVDDMMKLGIEPTATTFAHLIYAQRNRPYTNLWNAYDLLNQLGIQLTPPVYTSIIETYAAESNVEMMLRVFFAMKERGLIPELAAAQTLVSTLATTGHSRLAIEVANYFEEASTRQLEPKVWLECLTSSVDKLYEDGVLTCWPRVVDELNVLPPEGVCVGALNTAARAGLPELATDVLRVLKLAEIEWQEYHFAALIEAFCRNNQLKEALITLSIMRQNDIEPLESTTSFIYDIVKQDVDSLDLAWGLVDEIKESGSGLDIEALKVVLKAAVFLGDLQRAVGIYKAIPNYNLTPDLAIFNLLFQGCITAQHRQLGDLLLADMKAAKIEPNKETFEKLIYLALTQETYEDAFFYLEEMKAAKHLPPRKIYIALGDKCTEAQDPRADMVWQELRECGYRLDDPRVRLAARGVSEKRKTSEFSS
ncbi:Mitochondrial group I intron splicing factor CCM1 [Psilocybe cubensis]|uniref:Pentatricopeptide repeat-containing protein-mitochondrial domain-containing protein n=2 Tax=Psilocybe cubensis TaxID=181762 RepID=A0A8H7Y7G4_PSICU|nr:Mitochondrial group I intron splicing factor CCM1 [Psilocybe cubensis]KAH9485324.1 Mitochondrial group I intron splicing factor CCM1 [Psilocybe cubensis]